MISSDEMKDIFKIVKSLEDSGLLLKGVNERIKNEAKEESLCASLLGDMLLNKGVIRAGEGTARVGHGSKGSSLKRSSLKKF